MSDQYTRITCGGSPLAPDAPVVGLLFGQVDESSSSSRVLQIRDADDIPTEVSDATQVQVDLHRAVFPQHTVVGWYRVSGAGDEPTQSDLHISQQLRQCYAPSSPFCFCLLQVTDQDKKPSPTSTTGGDEPSSTMQEELPINLYGLHTVDGNSILLGLSNWQLETSDPERIAVERVMKEQPSDAAKTNAYTTQMKSMQHSLLSMKERIELLVDFLEQTQQGKIPPNYSLLRQVQGLLYSLGPLSSSCAGSPGQGANSVGTDAQLLSHLVVVAKTVRAVESYTDKFRVIHESKHVHKEMRRVF
jgi:COP9 signalosome complex subunit 6